MLKSFLFYICACIWYIVVLDRATYHTVLDEENRKPAKS